MLVTDSINGNYQASYQYDNTGNRTYSTIDGISTAYSYDANDRLIQQGGTTYGYDANGNTLTETLDGQTTQYSYDLKNQLVSVDRGGVITTYTYNANGIRTGKTEGAITTAYMVDENRDYAQVLQESDATRTITYTYGDDLVAQEKGGTTSYFHYDGLGSTRALTDASGNATDTYNYDAFGIEFNSTGTTENSYRFTGEQYDASLSQYYLRARYYDQGVGRFTQMDTWEGDGFDPVTLHKYLYANRMGVDPVNVVDFSGKFGLSSIGATLRVNGILSTSASAVGRSAIGRVLTGSGKEAFGIIGEEIIGFAKEALFNILTQELAGPGFKNAGAKGTAAHLEFQRFIESINEKYKKYGYTIHAEIFRDKDTNKEVKKRAKGSFGIDVEVRNSKDKTVLAFDLKTGRGTTKKKNRKLQGVFGTAIIEVFVSKKK